MNSFVESMPARYRAQYDAGAASQHARIATERSPGLPNVGLFRSSGSTQTGMCVVAQDEPGLLALISASLVESGLDVTEAEAYTRQLSSSMMEAVDLFWVRHLHPAHENEVTEADAERVHSALLELLAGHRRPTPSQRHPDSLTPGASETSVRFIEGESGGSIVTLEVETRDRSGLLLAVTEALFKERVQIVGSRISTRGGRVYDRFELLELDGSTITSLRRHALQLAILAAIDRGGTRSVASLAF